MTIEAQHRPTGIPGHDEMASLRADEVHDLPLIPVQHVERPAGAAGESEPARPTSAPTPQTRPAWAVSVGRRLMFSDLLVIAWACVGALVADVSGSSLHLLDPWSIGLSVGAILLWSAALSLGSTRDVSVLGHGAEEYKRVIQSSVTFFGVVAICSYVFDLALPRVYVLVVLPAGLAGLLASRFVWRRWLHVQRQEGRCLSKVLAVGNFFTVRDLIGDLKRAPWSGYQVVGVCLTEPSGRSHVDGLPVVGGLDDIAQAAVEQDVDVVAVASTSSYGPARVRKLGWELESTSIGLVLAPALTNIAGPRVHTTPVAGLPLIHVDRPTYRGANKALKRSFDLLVGGLVVVLASPVLAVLAAWIKLTDGGSIFFRQDRVGLNGSTFKMIKFRSMVEDAEARLAELAVEQRDAGNDVMFKLKDDPRVTRVGRILRKFSLDELPQLFNVLKGDMSLVGPRPPLRSEVDLYGEDAMLRLLVKPGMTGLWQVSGRSNLSWEDSVRLDTYYVENWSITSDLVILFKTAKAVVSSAGAY